MTSTEATINNYCVFGSINQRKMKRVGVSFAKYLADLGKKFKLTPEAEILGMEKFGFNARSHNNRYSLPGEDYTRNLDIQINNNTTNDVLNEAGFDFPHDLMTPPHLREDNPMWK